MARARRFSSATKTSRNPAQPHATPRVGAALSISSPHCSMRASPRVVRNSCNKGETEHDALHPWGSGLSCADLRAWLCVASDPVRALLRGARDLPQQHHYSVWLSVDADPGRPLRLDLRKCLFTAA